MTSLDVFGTVREILIDRFQLNPDDITLEANLFEDLGFDSIDAMTVIVAIEEIFDIEVQETEFEGVVTIADAVALLEGKVAAKAAV